MNTTEAQALVNSLYGSVGRSGIGQAVNQIDQGGYDYWTNQLVSGAVDPNAAQQTFSTAINQYVAQNPNDPYSQYIASYQKSLTPPAVNTTTTPPAATTAVVKPPAVNTAVVKPPAVNTAVVKPPAVNTATAAATPTASNPFPGMTVEDLYRMHAGKEPDAEGLAFWQNAFGPEIDEAERAQFIKSVLEAQNKPAAAAGTPSKATAPAAASTPTDPVAALYQSVLGRTPSQAEIDSWGFGSEVDATELDRFLGAARNEVAQTKPTEGVTGQLAKQILAQGTTGKWGGEGYGSAEQNAYDMAAMLAAQGITDINQFGVRDKQVTPEARYNEQGGLDQPEGTYTTKEYYNKSTGQPINSYYDKAMGNIWGGTFAGEGSTAYGVQFQPDGTPIFYSQYGGSSNDVANLMADFGPAGQIALAIATGGLSIPQQIAAQAAIGLASGKDVGDIAKGALASFAMAGISDVAAIKDGAKYLNSVDPSGVLSGAFQGAVMSGAKAGLTGQSIGDAVMSGAIAGGTSGAVNAALDLPEFQGLSSAQKKLAANAIGGALSGKPLDQVLINTAIAAGRAAIKGAQTPAPVEDMGPTSYGTNVTKQLTDAGLEEVGLPDGIQLAAADDGTLSDAGSGVFRAEMGAPTYAEDQRATTINPPAGYRVMAKSEQEDRLVSEGVGDAPSKYETVRPAGAYYDRTLNAWLTPTGQFDAADDAQDLASYFGGSSRSESDTPSIPSNDGGTGAPTDLDYDAILESIGITNPSGLGDSPSNQEILDAIGYVPSGDAGTVNVAGKRPEPDLGTVNVTGKRPTPEPDFGTMEIVDKRPTPEPDFGTIEVVDKRPEPEPDLGTVEVVAPRPEPEVNPPVTPPVVTPPVVTPPVVTPPVVTPPVVTPPVTVPPKIVQQVALQFGIPATSQLAQDIAEALYGTMDYLDVGEEFSPSARKAKPAATQKQMQQTKMAQGGYLDNLLAENMSVDDLLNLLR